MIGIEFFFFAGQVMSCQRFWIYFSVSKSCRFNLPINDVASTKSLEEVVRYSSFLSPWIQAKGRLKNWQLRHLAKQMAAAVTHVTLLLMGPAPIWLTRWYMLKGLTYHLLFFFQIFIHPSWCEDFNHQQCHLGNFVLPALSWWKRNFEVAMIHVVPEDDPWGHWNHFPALHTQFLGPQLFPMSPKISS